MTAQKSKGQSSHELVRHSSSPRRILLPSDLMSEMCVGVDRGICRGNNVVP